MNIEIFEEKQFSLQIFFSLLQVHIYSVESFFYFSPKCLIAVRLYL